MWSSEPHEGVSKAKEVHVPSFLSYFKTLNSCPVLGIESLTSCFKVKLYTNWVNFVLLKSGLILFMTSCLYYSTVRQGWVDCPSCISVYSTGVVFICDGRGTRQRLDSIYIWMAKKVQRKKSLRFDRTYKLIIYHCLLKFITYPILTGGFWVLRLHFRIASQLSSLLMNLKVLHTVLWKGRNTDILFPGLFCRHIPLTVPVTKGCKQYFPILVCFCLNEYQSSSSMQTQSSWPRRVWLGLCSDPKIV